MLTDRSRIARPFARKALCSSLAIATALIVGSGMAQAQSFQGAGTVVSGGATITTGTNTTNIDINSTNADVVINWSTFDTGIGSGAINFQPSGTTATFQSTNAQFTVLNRILPTDPTRQIQFNGTVIGQLQGAATQTPAGTVYFYSPGGLIIGASAVLNVGNLGLTSAAPVVDGTGCFDCGPGDGQVIFSAANPGTRVDIQAGAQITGTGGAIGNYLAVVAPVINNSGTISGKRVNALISADAAVMTLHADGLFDIQVTSGTSGTGTTLFTNGSITGPAGDVGNASRTYLVAVPKNTAITMVVGNGSTLGFDIADAADLVGNAVVLSGGFDISGGTALPTPSAGGGTGQTQISIANSTVTSALDARATGQAQIVASSGLTSNYASDVSLAGAQSSSNPLFNAVQINSSGAGSQLNIAGNVTVTALDPALVAPASGFQVTNFAIIDATVGGNIAITGSATLHNDKFNPNGSATPGQARIAANGGSQLTIGNGALLTAIGSGGDSSTAGVAVGNGTGGQTLIDSRDAGTLVSITGLAQQQTFGFAGSALVAGALPGTGRGGNARITASLGGRVAISGNADLNVQGSGMSTATPGTDGSIGIGGTTSISQVTGGRVTVGGDVLLLANGFGGHNYGGGDLIAGNGTGGDARFVVNDPGGLQAGGNVIIDATGVGGEGRAASGVSSGGAGMGGIANVGSVNGLNRILGNVTVTAQGFGGAATLNGTGGLGRGGSAIVGLIPGTGGAITIGNGGNSFVGATGNGGAGAGAGAGGAGTGGTAQIFGQGGIVTISDATDVHANGNGGNAVNGVAGTGTGGLSSIRSDNSGSAVRFTGTGNVGQNAGGFGGFVVSGTGSGGAGIGGTSTIDTLAAGQVSIAGLHDSSAFAQGGSALTGSGGTGQGGNATVNANTGSITLSTSSILTSSAFGGNSSGAGAGGNATSGTSTYFTSPTGGSITVTGPASARSQAHGGNSASGAAGNAVSSGARFLARNGTIAVSGLAIADATATGGNGRTVGGNATGGDAAVIAGVGGVGGSITLGAASLNSGADGGDGTIGGNATGTSSRLVASAGSITITGLTAVSSSVSGGDGLLGGAGGAATGGTSLINALNNVGGASTVTLGTTVLFADAFGGAGGAGTTGGGAGGVGGAAGGGAVQVLGGAGNGTLVTGDVTTSAFGLGGIGGAGGTGATGGTGGAGGRAVGGFIQIGTASFFDNSPTNTGSGTFGAVSEAADAVGGAGGAGGSGTTSGAGGRGGDAFNGGTVVLVRGSPVTFNGAVDLSASALGGNGGSGSVQGAGGNATVGTDPVVLNPGGLGVTVTNRFTHPEQPGSLFAGSITGNAFATGGTGSTPGASLLADVPFRVEFTNSTATIDSLELNAVAITPLAGAVASPFIMTGSIASISDLFLNTLGTLSLALDTSTLNTDTLTLSAANFVLPATPPVAYGTINVSSGLTISALQDFLAYANFNVGFAGGISTTGSIFTGNLTFAGPLDVTAGGSITTGTISASDVAVDAGQSILTAAITTGGDIDLDAGGAITTGQLTAGDTVTAVASGAINVAGASAGIVNPSASTGAEYNIGLRSLTSVTAGNLAARASIGLSSPGSITAGNLSAGLHVLGLAGTGITTGSITTPQTGSFTPQTFFGNFSMEALGGQIGATFNPLPIFQATTVTPIAGPIAINGGVTTGSIRAASTGTVAVSGPILTGFTASLNGAQGVSVGVGAPGAFVPAAVTAGQLAVLVSSAGAVSAGAVTAGDSVTVAGLTGVTLGNVSAGIVNPTTNPNANLKIGIASGNGSVTTGSLTARRDIGAQAGQALSVGAVAGRDILLLGGTTVTTGAITAGSITQPTGRIIIANSSMATPTVNVFTNFSNVPIFGATTLIPTGGAITINGAVSAGSLRASSQQGIGVQAVTTPALSAVTGFGGFIELESGGTVTVNGRLAGGDRIDIISRDIDITQTGSLDALGASGEILLASTNPNGMFVGDGLTTTNGYSLSNAEYGRLRAGEIAIVGTDIANLATDLTIGTLTINASQLYGANGIALFASGNRETETPSGILRIAGAVTANGFAPTNEIELLSGTVELEAEKGSLKVNSGGTDSGTTGSPSSSSLGGLIFVEADHIHIASDAILTKLRADPFYTGHIDELNAPATVQRPDGVFNALGFEVVVGETFYIQNTGSRVVPAGFLTTFDATDVSASDELSTTKGELVLNGQFQTSTGIVTGKTAFDLVIADMRSEPGNTFDFSDTSTLNGCVFLSGVCAFGQSDPVAALSSEISVVTNATLDESPVAPAADDSDEGDEASGDKDDDDNSSDEGSSPIAPPTPLISTRALDGAVNVVEPVSGAGNPALFGSAVNETTVGGGKP